MPTIKSYYHNLTRTQKTLFRDKIIKDTGINYTLFFSWITRNSVPKIHQTFIENIIKNPVQDYLQMYNK